MPTKSIIITGCSGFIGSHAVDHFLNRGYRVIGIDCYTYAGKTGNLFHLFNNKNLRVYNLDICKTHDIIDICEHSGAEWIINFAAETHVDNSINSAAAFIHSNISGVESLLRVCRSTGIKLLHVSTDEVYGSIKDGSFFENDKLNPLNPYSATKAAAEHFIMSNINTYNVDSIIVRPSNNFGPRQHSEKFLPTIIRSLSNGKKIPVYGNGENIRDWLFVKDNVRAIDFLIGAGTLNDVYNITSSNEMTNLKIIDKICSLLNRNFYECIEFVKDRPGHDFRYSISNKKLLDLGFEDFTGINDAISETVTSMNNRFSSKDKGRI